MHPFVFETSFFSLRWEQVAIMLGILAGIWLVQKRTAHKGAAYQNTMLDLATWLVIAGLAGARIWELIWTWDFYNDSPWDRLALWKGGMSIQGSILGGLLAALIFAWRKRLRVWELLDILAPAVILGQAIGRVGCFMSGDAFGRPISEIPWLPQWLGVVYAPETPAWFVMGPVPLVPAELFELVLDLLIFGFLIWYKPRNEVPGRTVLTYGILYSVARFGLEFLRADSLTFLGLKVAQLLSVGAVLVCGALLVQRYRAHRVRDEAKSTM